MTGSNVFFSASIAKRQHHRKIVRKDQDASCMSNSIQDGACFENSQCFPRGRNHRTRQLPCREVSPTLPSDTRHHILVRTGILQTGLWYDGAKRTRPGTDGPETPLEPYPLRGTTNLRRQLATSFTNRECGPLFRCIRADADVESAKTPITTEKT